MMPNYKRIGLEIAANITPLERGLKSLRKGFQDIDKANKKMTQGGFFSLFSGRAARDLDKGLSRTAKGIDKIRREHQKAARAAKESAKAHKELQDLADHMHRQGHKPSLEFRRKLQASQQMARQDKAYSRQTARAVVTAEEQFQEQQAQAQEAHKKRRQMKRRAMLKGGMGILGGAAGAAFAAGRWVKGQADAGYQVLLDNQLARMETERLAGGANLGRKWRDAANGAAAYGRSLAYTTAEAHKLTQATLRATGLTDPRHARANMALARGYTLDPNAIAGYQASLRQSGGRITSTREINKALVSSLRAGGFARPLMQELMQASQTLAGTTADSRERYSGGLMSGLIGFLGNRLGGGFSRSPARTGRLLGGLHGTIAQTSGDDAGMAFRLRAAGFGQGRSYVQALEQLEKGVTDPSNVRNLVGQVKSEYQGEDMQALALHRLSGGRIKLWQSRRLLQANLGDMDRDGIASLMRQQGAVNLGKEAGKSRRGTGLIRREITKGEVRAQTRLKLDPLYDEAFKLQTQVLRGVASLLKDLGPTLKALKDYLQKRESTPTVKDQARSVVEQKRPFFLEPVKPVKPGDPFGIKVPPTPQPKDGA